MLNIFIEVFPYRFLIDSIDIKHHFDEGVLVRIIPVFGLDEMQSSLSKFVGVVLFYGELDKRRDEVLSSFMI